MGSMRIEHRNVRFTCSFTRWLDLQPGTDPSRLASVSPYGS
jgi:hypothetical protein